MYYLSVVLVGNISKEKVVDFIYLAISVKDMRFKGLLLVIMLLLCLLKWKHQLVDLSFVFSQ